MLNDRANWSTKRAKIERATAGISDQFGFLDVFLMTSPAKLVSRVLLLNQVQAVDDR